MKDLRFFVAVCLLFPFCGFFPSPGQAQEPTPAGRIVAALDESRRIVLKGSTHPLARREFDAGAAPDNLPMESILLILKRSAEQEKALEELLTLQQTKGSPNFHQWLTPEEFGKRFGPGDADLGVVKNWLASHGFAVKRVSAGRTTLEFSGTAGQVRDAFRTEIHKYIIRGQEHWANNRDIAIPEAVAPVVHGLVSLNNFSQGRTVQQVQSFALSKSTGTLSRIRPETTLAGCNGSSACYGVGPADFATIYDVNPLYATGTDGTGETIAIASSSNIHLSDAHNFRALFSLPTNDPQIMVIGPDPGAVPGEEGLTNLQVQWAGAVAPHATILLVVTQSTSGTEGANLAAATIVDNNLAPVMTLNFTACEPAIGATGSQSAGSTFYQVLWEQAAAEGITVVAPTGDTGAAGCDSHLTEIAATGGLNPSTGNRAAPGGLAVNATASTAYNVAVGGTDFNQVGIWSQYWNSTNDPTTSGSAKSYIPEETWNDSCAENGPNGCANPNISGSDLVAGGGGCSIATPAPPWQSGTGACVTTGARAVPDLSMFAGDGNNGSFYLVCQGDANSNGDPSCTFSSPYTNIQGLGGTAAAAATFAGVMALVDQKFGPQGNANVVLYPLAASTTANAFHDVTQGDTSVACVAAAFLDCSNQGTGYGIIADVDGAIWSAAPGYDLATGLGSVDVNNLVTQWSSVNRVGTTTTIVSTNPASLTSLTLGQQVGFQIQVSAASGTPTGDVALMIKQTPPTPSYAVDFFTPLVNGVISDTACAPPVQPRCSPPGITTKLPGSGSTGTSYQVFARYAGDDNFAPSDSSSSPVTVNVTQQTSQVTIQAEDFSNGPLNCFDSGLTNNTGNESYGGVYYLRVIVGNTTDQESPSTGCFSPIGNKIAPTGTITLTDTIGGTTVPLGAGTYALNSRGYLELPTVPVSFGVHQIMASYSGDASYQKSIVGPFQFPIGKASSLINLSASATLIGAGQSVTITANLFNTNHGAGFLPPSGTVTFLAADGSNLGSAPLAPNSGSPISSSAQLTITPTKPVTISAQYGGDNNYNGSTSETTLTINIGTPDFKLSNSTANLKLTAGQPGTATITVTSFLGFTGAVALACPAASSLPPGMTCGISPSTVTLAANGNPVTATITLGSQGPSVIMASAKPGSREWMFALTSGSLACAGVLFLGIPRRRRLALLPMAMLAVYTCGSCSSIAHNQSTPSVAIALTTSSVKSPQGTPVTLTAAISANHAVTGTVDFADNGTPIAQGVTVLVGRAAFSTNSLVLGTHPITAAYSGDGNTHAVSTATPLDQVITGTSQMQITATSGNLTHSFQLQFSLN